MTRRTVGSKQFHTALVAAFLLVGLVLGPGSVAAQDASPSVDLAGTSIEIDGGETSTVTAEYEFEVASAGSGESELTSISGTMWQLPDREVGDISATVDGESVDASVSGEDRHWGVSVPVEDVSDGDTVTVTLEYEVAGPAGDLRVPLWVPEYSTPGQANVVDATLTLPEGTTVAGGAFPGPATVDGNTATYELLHVPGFIAAEYGESGPGLLTEDFLYSLLGVVVIVGFVVGGLAIDRKTA
ncbi:MAG: hypothetical protein ACOCQL_00380 [Halolamina sp.]